jgi:hypothetical protein
MQAIKQPRPFNPSHATFLEDNIDKPLNTVANRYQRNPAVEHWLESVARSETYRERNCRSATILYQSDYEPVPRRLTKSAPAMANRRDSDGFAIPDIPTPSSRSLSNADGMSLNAPSSTATSSTSRKRSLVQTPNYRDYNLAINNIFIRYSIDEHIAHLVEEVRVDRIYLGRSLSEIREDRALKALEMGKAETDVEMYFQNRIFTEPPETEPISRSTKSPMAKQVVPDYDPRYKVSIPVPDMLYGYSRTEAFTERQQALLISMGTEMVANSGGVLYPFLYVEFKGDGPSGSGSLWVGTNQCLGGSASCVNIVDRLNRRLRSLDESLPMINNIVFSIVMNGTEARLYVSWMHDEVKCYMAKVDSFLLQRPEDFIEFHKIVLNIMDWGKGKHLDEIRKALDVLIQRG